MRAFCRRRVEPQTHGAHVGGSHARFATRGFAVSACAGWWRLPRGPHGWEIRCSEDTRSGKHGARPLYVAGFADSSSGMLSWFPLRELDREEVSICAELPPVQSQLGFTSQRETVMFAVW